MPLNKREVIETLRSEEIVSATCDICGGSCDLPLDIAGQHMSTEYLTLSASWGYASRWDGEAWEAVACVDCVKKHLEPLVRFARLPGF